MKPYRQTPEVPECSWRTPWFSTPQRQATAATTVICLVAAIGWGTWRYPVVRTALHLAGKGLIGLICVGSLWFTCFMLADIIRMWRGR